jgi:hypothetical protein
VVLASPGLAVLGAGLSLGIAHVNHRVALSGAGGPERQRWAAQVDPLAYYGQAAFWGAISGPAFGATGVLGEVAGLGLGAGYTYNAYQEAQSHNWTAYDRFNLGIGIAGTTLSAGALAFRGVNTAIGGRFASVSSGDDAVLAYGSQRFDSGVAIGRVGGLWGAGYISGRELGYIGWVFRDSIPESVIYGNAPASTALLALGATRGSTAAALGQLGFVVPPIWSITRSNIAMSVGRIKPFDLVLGPDIERIDLLQQFTGQFPANSAESYYTWHTHRTWMLIHPYTREDLWPKVYGPSVGGSDRFSALSFAIRNWARQFPEQRIKFNLWGLDRALNAEGEFLQSDRSQLSPITLSELRFVWRYYRTKTDFYNFNGVENIELTSDNLMLKWERILRVINRYASFLYEDAPWRRLGG